MKRKTSPVPPRRPIEVAQRVANGSRVSLAHIPSLDDLNPRGIWGRPARIGRGLDVTAAICGDPAPGRSALEQRMTGGEA